jgi:hypothetical protein
MRKKIISTASLLMISTAFLNVSSAQSAQDLELYSQNITKETPHFYWFATNSKQQGFVPTSYTYEQLQALAYGQKIKIDSKILTIGNPKILYNHLFSQVINYFSPLEKRVHLKEVETIREGTLTETHTVKATYEITHLCGKGKSSIEIYIEEDQKHLKEHANNDSYKFKSACLFIFKNNREKLDEIVQGLKTSSLQEVAKSIRTEATLEVDQKINEHAKNAKKAKTEYNVDFCQALIDSAKVILMLSKDAESFSVLKETSGDLEDIKALEQQTLKSFIVSCALVFENNQEKLDEIIKMLKTSSVQEVAKSIRTAAALEVDGQKCDDEEEFALMLNACKLILHVSQGKQKEIMILNTKDFKPFLKGKESQTFITSCASIFENDEEMVNELMEITKQTTQSSDFISF